VQWLLVMANAEKIKGISWALFTVALSLGYTLGLCFEQMAEHLSVRWLLSVPPLVACVLIYRKLTTPHDVEAASGDKEKEN